ncbi:Protein phnB, partial [human gut metagenome]
DAMPSGKASYSGFTLVLDSQQVEEGKRWFDNLAANGKIEMAWQETFWAHGFGKVTDKFGVPWMINVVKQQPFAMLFTVSTIHCISSMVETIRGRPRIGRGGSSG